MSGTSTAILGAAGGVGTTRITVELGATLSRAGHDVAILDTALATQGLSRHVRGSLDPDLTRVLVDEASIDAALVDHPYTQEVPGQLQVAPAYAPFERIARAKTAESAQELHTTLESLAERFEFIFVDTPPLATNPAVAAVTATDHTAVVTDHTPRGIDALQQTRGRLADVGGSADCVIGNRVPTETGMPDADALIPPGSVPPAGDAPAAYDPGNALAPAYAATLEALLNVRLDLDFERGLLDRARGRFE